MCLEAVESVLGKREVQNAIMTGIFVDEAAEKGLVDEESKLEFEYITYVRKK